MQLAFELVPHPLDPRLARPLRPADGPDGGDAAAEETPVKSGLLASVGRMLERTADRQPAPAQPAGGEEDAAPADDDPFEPQFTMTVRFTDSTSQRDWFVELIDDEPPPGADEPPLHSGEDLTPAGIRRVVMPLLGGLQSVIDAEQG